MAVKFYIDTTGDVIGRFSPKEWADWINSFLKEKVFFVLQTLQTVEDQIKWLEKKVNELREGKTIMIIAVDEQKRRIVGTCEVRRASSMLAEQHNITFGLAIHRDYRGRGMGKKLLKKGIEVAKRCMKAKNMWIEYIDGNDVAKHLYESLGFVEWCRLPKYVKHYGKYRDMVKMLYVGNKKT